jgi:hypothetical protein
MQIPRPRHTPNAWWPVFLGHYLDGKKVAHGQMCRDLAMFPPIAARVMELQCDMHERAGRPRSWGSGKPASPFGAIWPFREQVSDWR